MWTLNANLNFTGNCELFSRFNFNLHASLMSIVHWKCLFLFPSSSKSKSFNSLLLLFFRVEKKQWFWKQKKEILLLNASTHTFEPLLSSFSQFTLQEFFRWTLILSNTKTTAPMDRSLLNKPNNKVKYMKKAYRIRNAVWKKQKKKKTMFYCKIFS